MIGYGFMGCVYINVYKWVGDFFDFEYFLVFKVVCVCNVEVV